MGGGLGSVRDGRSGVLCRQSELTVWAKTVAYATGG